MSYPGIFLEGLYKTKRNLNISGVQDEVGTDYLQNSSHEDYRSTKTFQLNKIICACVTGLERIRKKWLNVTINKEIRLNLIANVVQGRLKLNLRTELSPS
jgi:hypothetical protein